MKTKVANRIIRSAANGTIYPLHTLHKASLQAKLPVLVKTGTYDSMIYWPKKLQGDFALVFNWNNRSKIIRPLTADLHDQYDHVRELKSPASGTLWFYPDCNIEYATAEACRLARSFRATIQFDFNQVNFEVRPFNTGEELYQWWLSEIERKRNEWCESADGIAYLAEIAKVQPEVTRLIGVVEALPKNDGTQENTSAWLDWLYDFCLPGGNINGEYDKQLLAQTLEAGGWILDQHALKLDDDTTDEMRKLAREAYDEKIKNSPQIHAEYIMGQAIACLKIGFGPHSVCRKFITEYREAVGNLETIVEVA